MALFKSILVLVLAVSWLSISVAGAVETEESTQSSHIPVSGAPATISSLHSSLAEYDMFQRPDPEGAPTNVLIGVYLADIVDISDIHRYIDVDFAVELKWHDPRLANSSRKSHGKIRRFKLNDVWNPRVVILNSSQLSKHREDVVLIDDQGTVTYAQRFTGKLSFKIDLIDFPFDTHKVTIGLVSATQNTDEVVFQADQRKTGRAADFSIVDFDVGPGNTTAGIYHYSPTDQKHPTFLFEFYVHRHSAFYVLKVFIPLFLIVIMSWTVFWIDPAQVGPQVGISTASIFTLVIFQFNLARLVPRVPYLMMLDYYSFCAIILVFLALIEAIVSTCLVRLGKEKMAAKMDWWSRLVFPLVFVTFLAVIFLALK